MSTTIDEVAVERATRGWRLELTDDERLEVIRRMNANGASDIEIGRVAGRCADVIRRIRHQHNIPPARTEAIPTSRAPFYAWLKETA